MSPQQHYRQGIDPRVRLLKSGKISFPKITVRKLGWLPGTSQIDLKKQEEKTVNLVLYFSAEVTQNSYKLHENNSGSEDKGGGWLSHTKLRRSLLRERLKLPIAAMPIFLEKYYEVALIVETNRWRMEDFSKAGTKEVNSSVIGTYQVLNAAGDILKVGQGRVRNRIAKHLQNSDYYKAESFRYIVPDEPADTTLLEHVYLQKYKQENDGELPPLNKINA